MRTIDNQSQDIFLNGLSLLLGIGLIAAPWYFGFASETAAAWNAWIFGTTVAILAVLALEATVATWAHVSFGIALVISASSEVWRLRESPSAYEV